MELQKFKLRFSWHLALSLAASTCMAPAALAVPNVGSPFTYALAGYTDANGVDHSDEQVSTSNLAIAALAGSATARASATSGYKYPSVGPNQSSWALSLFADALTVNGSSGSGILNLSVDIHGTASGTEWDQGYLLFVSTTPFSLQSLMDEWTAATANCKPDTSCSDDLTVAGATRVISRLVLNADHSPNTVLTAQVPFTYGVPIYTLSYFSGDGNTEVNFYDSAIIGITAPTGASIYSASGTSYASAVPEPSTSLLIVAGILAVQFRALQKVRSSEA